MNRSVDNYFLLGCGRCSLGGTPDCKVHKWASELDLLRSIILESGLREECKWGVPCYTHDSINVLLLAAFKDFCSISFLKGSLLSDSKKLLEKPGENSQAARLLKFKDVKRIKKLQTVIKTYIHEAIEVEKAGLKVTFVKNPEPLPIELEDKLEEDAVLKAAFESLTPGRQRGYIIFFSSAKQPKTRIARIEKCIDKILNGEGLNDKYKRSKP